MPMSVSGRRAITVVATGLMVCILACDDDTVLVSVPVFENGAPEIVAQGPELPVEPLNLRPFDDAPRLHVVVSDPNGLDDLAAIYLEFDSLVVNHIIARRSLQEVDCRQVVYVDFDTLAVTDLFPSSLPGVSFIRLERAGGGLFVSPPFCTQSWTFLTPVEDCALFPHFENLSAAYGFPPCIDGTEWLWAFVLFPPLVPSQTTVFITEANVEYAGLRAIVFDGEGLSDTAFFGNLPVIHTTDAERRVAP